MVIHVEEVTERDVALVFGPKMLYDSSGKGRVFCLREERFDNIVIAP